MAVKSGRKAPPLQRPARFAIALNGAHTLTTQYATLVHELAHLYGGHLGTPNDLWWPDRSSLAHPAAQLGPWPDLGPADVFLQVTLGRSVAKVMAKCGLVQAACMIPIQ